MIYILGRQPAIGLAELESLYDSKNLRPVGNHAALVDTSDPINFGRIGGALKAGTVLATIDSTDLNAIKKQLEHILSTHLNGLVEGKFKLGISCYGLDLSPAKINALGLGLKKVIKASGRSVRLIPNPKKTLNSAQVLNNKLTSELGCELLLVRDGMNTIIAQTTAVQDIDSYTLRDRGRPKRDARVGMLPPKLAQTIINLTGATAWTNILDPFCGTGVLLQEGWLMDLDVCGSDIDPRMVDYSKSNLAWINEKFGDPQNGGIDSAFKVEVADATRDAFPQSFNPKGYDAVASEIYLGRPFTSVPDKEILQKTIHDCDTILKKFLKNLAGQTKTGTRMCLAIPAWFVGKDVHHLKTLDQLSDLGYNRISFVHSDNKDLIYHRDDQIVGRELLVISRK